MTVAALALAGCHDWRAGVTDTASVQHGCPPERIRILEYGGHRLARVVELDVCGQRRVYQDINGSTGTMWVDQTPTSSGGEAPIQLAALPALPDVTPAATSISAQPEPAFAATVRERLQERASAILTCTGGPVAIQARWAASSPAVELAARGVTDPVVAQCIGAIVGAIEVPPGTPPGELLHPITN